MMSVSTYRTFYEGLKEKEADAATVIERFRENREGDIQGDVVLREFIDDLTGVEIRTWWRNGELVLTTPHPDQPNQKLLEVPTESITSEMKQLNLPFCTVDFAERESGWIVIEVGDGGVSDLPESVQASQLYQAI